MQTGYEIDELSTADERVTLSLHRSLLANMAEHMKHIRLDDNNRINKAIRSLGFKLDAINLILYGTVKATGTEFEDITDLPEEDDDTTEDRVGGS